MKKSLLFKSMTEAKRYVDAGTPGAKKGPKGGYYLDDDKSSDGNKVPSEIHSGANSEDKSLAPKGWDISGTEEDKLIDDFLGTPEAYDRFVDYAAGEIPLTKDNFMKWGQTLKWEDIT